MDKSQIDKIINDLKAEAVTILDKEFLHLPDKISSPDSKKLIDCIINATILSIVLVQKETIKKVLSNETN